MSTRTRTHTHTSPREFQPTGDWEADRRLREARAHVEHLGISLAAYLDDDRIPIDLRGYLSTCVEQCVEAADRALCEEGK